MVTAAPVSIFASIVRFSPVNGFSRLIKTYTCSYGAVNFNRSIISVLGTTLHNFRFGQFFWTFPYKSNKTKVWHYFFRFINHC